MIIVKLLNGQDMALNAELIERISENPDTVISLTTGNRILVKDSMKEVMDKITAYRRLVASGKGKKKKGIKLSRKG